ncbi:hypothetical protein K435DRAFT_398496 [Dendrothele bispora CBS 962.96]|uniref:Uncharacterized protein n=1 Tax=Dendrothele bispora (strain CBS 962.96) TaxID=1314807 RepID=A0A4S8L864_DENBC|nr:hypothetical protein K435DRAFT_505225 [Dendrothele bispora CBS 962.96]THU84731.1 hypothetical protein K435DRAFT_398496 [Dendrothele bispora CBS 962.96]
MVLEAAGSNELTTKGMKAKMMQSESELPYKFPCMCPLCQSIRRSPSFYNLSFLA